jgi:hypothetical protein
MRRAGLGLAILLAAVLAAAGPAVAHTDARDAAIPLAPAVLHETLTAAPALPSVPWTALALLGGVALSVATRPRRALALTLALVVAVLAFETGVHSTHHLGRGDEAAHCLVASMSTQLSAYLVDVAVETSLVGLPEAASLAPATPDVDTRHIAPDAGRAPPVRSS